MTDLSVAMPPSDDTAAMVEAVRLASIQTEHELVLQPGTYRLSRALAVGSCRVVGLAHRALEDDTDDLARSDVEQQDRSA